jgi:uncharacterized protein YukE
MAKINLSIPDELKAQMDALPSRQWSQVAARAFWNEVKLQTLKGENMSEALERLRASKQQAADRDRAAGAIRGQEWAKSAASWDALRVVGELAATPKVEVTFDMLAEALKEELEWDYEEVLELFGRDKHAMKPSDELVDGFVAGVSVIYAEV